MGIKFKTKIYILLYRNFNGKIAISPLFVLLTGGNAQGQERLNGAGREYSGDRRRRSSDTSIR